LINAQANNEKLQKENVQLKADNAGLLCQVKANEARIARQDQELKKLRAENTISDDRIGELLEKNTKLARLLKEAQKHIGDDDKKMGAFEEWKKEDAKKDKERDDLIQKLTKEKKTLIDEKSALEKQIDSKEAEINASRVRVAELTKKLEELTKGLKATEEKLLSAEVALGASNAANVALKDEVQQTTDDLTNLQHEKAVVDGQLKEAHTKLAGATGIQQKLLEHAMKHKQKIDKILQNFDIEGGPDCCTMSIKSN